MITPFLALVLAGFAAFIGVVGTVWARSYADDLREARARTQARTRESKRPQVSEVESDTNRHAA